MMKKINNVDFTAVNEMIKNHCSGECKKCNYYEEIDERCLLLRGCDSISLRIKSAGAFYRPFYNSTLEKMTNAIRRIDCLGDLIEEPPNDAEWVIAGINECAGELAKQCKSCECVECWHDKCMISLMKLLRKRT